MTGLPIQSPRHSNSNDAPDSKVAQQAEDKGNGGEPGPSKPPALFDEGSSYSYFGNLVALLRQNSERTSGGDKAGADAGAALSRAAPSLGDVELPAEYLGFCKGDKAKALALWEQGQAIRRELGLDGVLDAPFELYQKLEQHFPVALHGTSKAGEAVLIQMPGKIDVAALKAIGVGQKEVVKYFTYHLEFLNKVSPNSKVLLVIDMSGLGLMKLVDGEFLSTVRSISDTLSAAYCRKVTRYAITSPPAIFTKLWSILCTVLPAGASDNVTVCKDAAALEALLEPHLIPTHCGGTLPLGEAEEQRKLRAHLASQQ